MEGGHGRLFQKMLHDAAYCGSLGPALLGRVGCLPTLLGRGLERAVRRLAATLTATCRSNCPRRCEPSGCAHPESLRHCPKLICRTCSLQGNEDVRSEMRCPDRCRVRVVASWLTITLVSLPGGAFQPSSSSFSSPGRRSSSHSRTRFTPARCASSLALSARWSMAPCGLVGRRGPLCGC